MNSAVRFRRVHSVACLALLLAGVFFSLRSPLPLRASEKEQAQTLLKVGDAAPDFTLKSFEGGDMKDVSLHDYKGKKNVLLAFYVFAFTGG